jgi:stage V sporulation protein S
MEPLKVSSNSQVSHVAGAIAGIIREGRPIEIHAIGAPAVHHTVKAIVTANKFLRAEEIRIGFTVRSDKTYIDGEIRNLIIFTVDRL